MILTCKMQNKDRISSLSFDEPEEITYLPASFNLT